MWINRMELFGNKGILSLSLKKKILKLPPKTKWQECYALGEFCLLTEAPGPGNLHVAFQIHFAIQNKNNGQTDQTYTESILDCTATQQWQKQENTAGDCNKQWAKNDDRFCEL